MTLAVFAAVVAFLTVLGLWVFLFMLAEHSVRWARAAVGAWLVMLTWDVATRQWVVATVAACCTLYRAHRLRAIALRTAKRELYAELVERSRRAPSGDV